MTLDERMKVFDTLRTEELKILSSKGSDYAGNEDALSNFKINAERLGLSKYQVWAVYAMKHIDAILTAIKNNPNDPTRQAETLYGSILDARNYLGLLACLRIEDDDKFRESMRALCNVCGGPHLIHPMEDAREDQ